MELKDISQKNVNVQESKKANSKKFEQLSIKDKKQLSIKQYSLMLKEFENDMYKWLKLTNEVEETNFNKDEYWASLGFDHNQNYSCEYSFYKSILDCEDKLTIDFIEYDRSMMNDLYTIKSIFEKVYNKFEGIQDLNDHSKSQQVKNYLLLKKSSGEVLANE